MESERLRTLFIEDTIALLLFTGRARITNIPAGCRFFNVYYNYERRGFCLLLEDENFEPVALGVIPPILEAELEMVD